MNTGQLIAGRFLSILRTYAAFLAGTSRMLWGKFLPANAAGGIVWAGIYTQAGRLADRAEKAYPGSLDGLPRRPEPGPGVRRAERNTSTSQSL